MIGDVLKQKRQERGVTQVQLAELIHSKQSEIARWETNRIKPSLSNIRKICDALEISIDMVLTISELQTELIEAVKEISDAGVLKQLLELTRKEI